MKKILLLDDRNERFNEIKVKASQNYERIIEVKDYLLNLSSLTNFGAFIIHSSYPDSAIYAGIKELAKNEQIPLIEFSGNAQDDYEDEYFVRMYADSLYLNLLGFLKDYHESGIIKVQRLVFGENFEEAINKIKIEFNAIQDAQQKSYDLNIKTVFLGEDEKHKILSRNINSQFISLVTKNDNGLHAGAIELKGTNNINAIIIPIALGTIYNSFLGLKLALHIRLTKELKEKRFLPIVFLVSEDILNILKELKVGYSSLLFSKGIHLINYSQINTINEIRFYNLFEIEEDFNNSLITSIWLPLPTGRHNLANEWGAYKLGFECGTQPKKPQNLILKYLSALNSVKQYNGGNAEDRKFVNLRWDDFLRTNNVKNILLIDDHAKLYKSIIEKIFKLDENPKDEVKVLESTQEFWEGEQFEEVIKEKYESIKKGFWDIIFLDLRIKKQEIEFTNANNISDFSGTKILKKIKKINPAQAVVIFTASNKANIIESLIDFGADGFFIKESPELSSNYSFSFNNYKTLLDTCQKSIEKSKILKFFWDKTENIISKIQIKDENIQVRIKEKLNLAFSILRNKLNSFERDVLNVQFTDFELAFLVYWSCLNEFIYDKVDFENNKGDADKKIISLNFKNGIPIIQNTLYQIESKVDTKPPYDFTTRFKGVKFRYYVKNPNTPSNEKIDTRQPSFLIPAFLLLCADNNAVNQNWIKEFTFLNTVRNRLDFTHADKNVILKETLSDRNITQPKEDCKRMINFLDFLLTYN